MAKPTKKAAKGFDLVLWVDPEGDVIASPYTKSGEEFIKSISPEWKPGVQMVVMSTPKRFFNLVPSHLTVGMRQPQGIATAITKTLH
jgi:hypothetical protein